MKLPRQWSFPKIGEDKTLDAYVQKLVKELSEMYKAIVRVLNPDDVPSTYYAIFGEDTLEGISEADLITLILAEAETTYFELDGNGDIQPKAAS